MFGMELKFDLTLLSINGGLVRAFEQQQMTGVKVRHTSLDQIGQHFDAIVSPANSYGRMDGGFDQAILDLWGEEVQAHVWKRIATRYGGYQPPGTAEVVDLGRGRGTTEKRFLVHAPTMSIPKTIVDDHIAYDSFWASLMAVHNHNKQVTIDGGKPIRKLLATGMGGGTGGISPSRCAQLMALAWKHFNQRNPRDTEQPTWDKILIQESEKGL